jgi:hypothetical protein
MQRDKLRQLLLGPSIYAHCSAKQAVSEEVLESRLETLKDLGCSKNMSVEDLVAMCSLNTTTREPTERDIVIQGMIQADEPCLEQSARIKIRQLLLGPTLYRQCNYSGGAATSDLESRLTDLQSRGCMQGRNVQHLVDVCALRPADETPFDLQEGEADCLDNERVRNLFFKGSTNLEGAKRELRRNCESISSTDEELNALFNNNTVGENIRADLELKGNNDCLGEQCGVCYSTSKQLIDTHNNTNGKPSGHLLCKDCLVKNNTHKWDSNTNTHIDTCPICKEYLSQEIIDLKDFLNRTPENVEYNRASIERDIAELEALRASHIAEAFGGVEDYFLNNPVEDYFLNNPLPMVLGRRRQSNYFLDNPLSAVLSSNNQPLPDFSILMELYIEGDFNQLLPELPRLKYLTINGVFNQPLPELPNLLNLEIKGVFNQPLPVLPMLKYLTINSNTFNQPIVNLINLIILDIEKTDLFTSPISNLPNLENLIIYSYHTFNQPITGVPNLTVFRIVEGGEQGRQQVHTSLAAYNAGIHARLRLRPREDNNNYRPNRQRRRL